MKVKTLGLLALHFLPGRVERRRAEGDFGSNPIPYCFRTLGEARVFMYLFQMWRHGKPLFMGVAAMARETGLSEKCVRRALSGLKSGGVIEQVDMSGVRYYRMTGEMKDG